VCQSGVCIDVGKPVWFDIRNSFNYVNRSTEYKNDFEKQRFAFAVAADEILKRAALDNKNELPKEHRCSDSKHGATIRKGKVLSCWVPGTKNVDKKNTKKGMHTTKKKGKGAKELLGDSRSASKKGTKKGQGAKELKGDSRSASKKGKGAKELKGDSRSASKKGKGKGDIIKKKGKGAKELKGAGEKSPSGCNPSKENTSCCPTKTMDATLAQHAIFNF